MVMAVPGATAGSALESDWGSTPIFDLRQLALAAQVRRHVLVDVLEHRGDRRDVPVEQRAVALRLLLRGGVLGLELLLRRGVPLLRPRADADKVALQPFDRVAEREML